MAKPIAEGADWVLLEQARQGSRPAAQALVAHLRPRGYALALRLCGRHELAEEVLQESVLRLWRSPIHNTGEAQLATVFHTIVGREAMRVLSRSSHREWATEEPELLQDELSDAAEGDPLEALLEQAGRRELHEALAQLPGRQRQALLLWAQADQSTADIAQGMGMQPNAVSQLLFRARQSLAKIMSQRAPGGGHQNRRHHEGGHHEQSHARPATTA